MKNTENPLKLLMLKKIIKKNYQRFVLHAHQTLCTTETYRVPRGRMEKSGLDKLFDEVACVQPGRQNSSVDMAEVDRRLRNNLRDWFEACVLAKFRRFKHRI